MTDRIRLFDAANRLHLSSEAMAHMLRELGFQVRGYTSYIAMDAFEKVRAKLRDEKKTIKDSLRQRKAPEVGRVRVKVDDQKIDRSLRETIAKVDHRVVRKRHRSARDEGPVEAAAAPAARRSIKVTPFMSVAELAHAMGVDPASVIKKCFSIGLLVTMNQRLDLEAITLTAAEFGFDVELAPEVAAPASATEVPLERRPPIVAVMGHVDHGKTALLDYIRKTKVALSEYGRITQHTGAYAVDYQGKRICFLDTPGHEAFTAMRARGAQITDIVVLVVAADDGVMPQTREALDHARAANVPIIACITKVDLPGANILKVKTQLAEAGLMIEEYGGRAMAVETSVVTGQGIEDLLAAILVAAEELDLRARARGPAKGVVVDAWLDRGRGNLATVLILEGLLHRGDSFVCGEHYGRVRDLFLDEVTRVDAAPPSTPVMVLGSSGLPEAGDRLDVVADERAAREIAQKRAMARRDRTLARQSKLSLETIQAEIVAGKVKDLKVVLKGDVSGTVEALRESIQSLSLEDVKLEIIHSGVGAINISDVLLARASNAVIVGFHVEPLADARELADKEGIEIRTYKIIYDAIDDLRAAMVGMLEPERKETVIGKLEVRAVFKVPKAGNVAGCLVTEGKIERSASARLIRAGKVLHSATISSLKHFKDDVREMAAGEECGVALSDWNDYQPGDILEVFKVEEVKREA